MKKGTRGHREWGQALLDPNPSIKDIDMDKTVQIFSIVTHIENGYGAWIFHMMHPNDAID